MNIHYVSGSEVLGLRGLWKMSTLSNVQMLPQIGEKLVTISVRVKVAKYSQAIVLPLWSHCQFLHCCPGL